MIVAPAATKAETTPQCAQDWQKAEAQALAADGDKSDELREAGYQAYRRCFAAQAPRRSSFPALTRQAQALIDLLPKK